MWNLKGESKINVLKKKKTYSSDINVDPLYFSKGSNLSGAERFIAVHSRRTFLRSSLGTQRSFNPLKRVQPKRKTQKNE